MARKGDNGGGLKPVSYDSDSENNSGIVKTSVGDGQTFVEAYPIDRSSNIGPASAERIGGKFGGGMRDLSHSLGTGDRAAGPTPGNKDRT